MTEFIVTLLQSLGPCTVGLYYPVHGEPNLLGLCLDSRLSAYRWALPVCEGSDSTRWLSFREYKSDSALVTGRYGIAVPAQGETLQPDCLMIPCVGFHRQGARLGYGAGWYDQTLEKWPCKPLCVGVAYAFSEIAEPFAEPHDQLLSFVVTEEETISVKSSK